MAAMVSAPSRAISSFEVVDEFGDEFLVGETVAVAVFVGGHGVDVAGDAGAEAFVVGGDAGGGQCAHGDAVVAHFAGDDLDLVGLAFEVPVVAGDFEGGFVRLGAAGGEVDVVEGAGEELGEFGGELDGGGGGETEEGGDERDLVDLVGGGGGELVAAVTDVDVPESGEAVDVAFAVGVPEVDAFAAGEDEGAVVADRPEIGDGVEEVGFVFGDEFCGVPGLDHRHRWPSFPRRTR